ncbi:uncharacterized protein N7446_006107 [Penicillium canescens]|uniref:uncharacterized protein n=1 Tax=Penicillium canescens TaxID=5083 RepID=UPI0026DEC138|nr:uncharacterized protein N7446_006107 [Penicillium canescens]KAJ6061987.1 hypothetical protein N7446_006107 [Penicillium canescens]
MDQRDIIPPHSLISGLPDDYITTPFSKLEYQCEIAEGISESLNENRGGNQWLLVSSLPARMTRKLDGEERDILGPPYRFQWEGSTGLIKVIPPSFGHGVIISRLVMAMGRKFHRMGIEDSEYDWGGRTTFKPTKKGKQADETFFPQHRLPSSLSNRCGWPTLVIERGVSESLRRLREEAKWWFTHSKGQVRIVIVIGIYAPRPLTRQYRNALASYLPPSLQQPAETQQAYLAQKVYVRPGTLVGTPMVLPFATLIDRPPGPSEYDVILHDKDIKSITRDMIGNCLCC